MYCKHCGAQIDDNSKFCSSCGQSLGEITQTAPTNNIPNEEDIKIQEEKKIEAIKNKKKKTKKIVKITSISLGAALAVVLVLVLAVAPFIAYCNGDYYFINLYRIKGFEIPDGTEEIAEDAFYCCDSLEWVTIPDSVTSIGGWAFYGCSSLKSVVIPDGVTIIRTDAFCFCCSLEVVTIPVSVTKIEFEALYCCESLTSINYNGTKAQWKAIEKDDWWDRGGTENYTVYCTDGIVNKTLPEAELEQMFNQAVAFEESANFDKAFELFEILYENEYPDKDFSNQGLDEAFETRKGRYTRNSIVCRMYSYAVSSLKSALKDPNSLVIYKITMKVDSSNKYKIIITIDYGAANSFGAMVRDDYTYSYTLPSDDREAVYESLKDWMDERGATSEDSADYLVGNYNIYQQSQYDAIIAGTASY